MGHSISDAVLEQHKVGTWMRSDLVTCSCEPDRTMTPDEMARHIAIETVNMTVEHLTEGLRESVEPTGQRIYSVREWIESYREEE